VTLDAALREMIEKIVDERLARVLAERDRPAEYVGVAEAARRSSTCTKTVRRWIAAGKLTPRRAGRKLLVRWEELDQLLHRDGDDHELTPEQLADRDFR
jgi:excisionase family DNA binding protein